jgi:hypothetical protein
MGKNLDKRFYELGGKRFLELHCSDEVTDQDETIQLFIEKIMEYIIQLTN